MHEGDKKPQRQVLELHICLDPGLTALLSRLAGPSSEIIERLKRIEATMKRDFDTLLAALNDATNKLATDIQGYLDTIKAGGMTDAEEAEVQRGLGEAVTRLQGLGANPADPVPA